MVVPRQAWGWLSGLSVFAERSLPLQGKVPLEPRGPWTASRGLCSYHATGFSGSSLTISTSKQSGTEACLWGPDGSRALAHSLRVRALESALAQPGAITVSLEILTLSLPLNSLSFRFFSSVNGIPMPAHRAVVGTLGQNRSAQCLAMLNPYKYYYAIPSDKAGRRLCPLSCCSLCGRPMTTFPRAGVVSTSAEPHDPPWPSPHPRRGSRGTEGSLLGPATQLESVELGRDTVF